MGWPIGRRYTAPSLPALRLLLWLHTQAARTHRCSRRRRRCCCCCWRSARQRRGAGSPSRRGPRRTSSTPSWLLPPPPLHLLLLLAAVGSMTRRRRLRTRRRAWLACFVGLGWGSKLIISESPVLCAAAGSIVHRPAASEAIAAGAGKREGRLGDWLGDWAKASTAPVLSTAPALALTAARFRSRASVCQTLRGGRRVLVCAFHSPFPSDAPSHRISAVTSDSEKSRGVEPRGVRRASPKQALSAQL